MQINFLHVPYQQPGSRWLQSLLCGFSLMLAACQAPVLVEPPATDTVPATATVIEQDAEPGSASSDAIAVLTLVAGDIFWEVATEAIVGNQASAYEIVYEGDTIRAGAGGSATIFCFIDKILTLTGPGTVVVTGEACSRGDPIPAGAGRRVQPNGGRLIAIAGSLELEGTARDRENDYGNIPVILTPRNTKLIDLSPSLQWVEVPGTIEYVLELSGLGSFPDIILEAEDVACTNTLHVPSDRVCSAAWPVEWNLEVGKSYFLTVSARMSLASPLRNSEKSSLRTLDAESAENIENEVAAVELLNVSLAADLLLASYYAQAGLYAQAIPIMESLRITQPAPVLLVTLGDAYRATDLLRYAYFAYQDALALLDQAEDDPAARAAAEFGLGQIEYRQRNFERAQTHFAKAVELLTPLGTTEELAAATYGLGRTMDRGK